MLTQPGDGFVFELLVDMGGHDAIADIFVIAIKVDADEHVFALRLAKFGEDAFDNDRRRINLLESVLERGAERKPDEATQGHIASRAIKTFKMRGFDGRLANLLDVHGV